MDTINKDNKFKINQLLDFVNVLFNLDEKKEIKIKFEYQYVSFLEKNFIHNYLYDYYNDIFYNLSNSFKDFDGYIPNDYYFDNEYLGYIKNTFNDKKIDFIVVGEKERENYRNYYILIKPQTEYIKILPYEYEDKEKEDEQKAKKYDFELFNEESDLESLDIKITIGDDTSL